MIDSELIYVWRVQLHSFGCGYLVVLAPFVANRIFFFSLNNLGSIAKVN